MYISEALEGEIQQNRPKILSQFFLDEVDLLSVDTLSLHEEALPDVHLCQSIKLEPDLVLTCERGFAPFGSSLEWKLRTRPETLAQ
jgi:hypothetical protein